MIIFIVVLMLLSFLQSTLLPVNLVLLVIIARSFVVDEKINLYFAFFFGLLLSLFLGYPLGSLSLVYLFSVLAIKFMKKGELSTSWLSILLLSVILLLFDLGARSLLLKSSFNLPSLFPEFAFIIPVYFLVKFWEERFAVKPEIRLKVGK